jgi:hypothetical protein
MWYRPVGALLLGMTAACGGSSDPVASPPPSPVEAPTSTAQRQPFDRQRPSVVAQRPSCINSVTPE